MNLRHSLRTSFVCAAPKCHKRVSGLYLRFSSPLSYILNGNRYCSESCMRPQLQTFLTNSLIGKTYVVSHRNTVGLILLDMNILTLPQLSHVLTLKRNGDTRFLGDIIIEMGYANEQQVTLALGKQEGLPWIDVEERRISRQLKKMVPSVVVESSLLCPIEHDYILNELSLVAIAPLKRAAVEAVQQMNRCKVNLFIGPESRVRKLMQINYLESPSPHVLLEMGDLTMDDLYQYRDNLLYEYRTSSAFSLDIVSFDNYFWIRMYTEKATIEKFAVYHPVVPSKES